MEGLPSSLVSTAPQPGFSTPEQIVTVFAANFLGLLISVIFFGITTVQAVLYFQRFEDNRATRALILVLCMLQCGLLCESLRWTYAGLISSRGNYIDVVLILLKQYYLAFIIAVFESALLQIFLVYRIWCLSHSWIPTAPAALTVAAQVSVGFAFLGEWVKGDRVLEGVTLSLLNNWFVCEIVADFGIAFIMSALLLSRQSGISSTNTLLRRLVLYTISTGLFTGIVSVLSILGTKVPNTKLFIFATTLYPATFPVAMLANLHSRTSIRNWEKNRTPSKRLDPVEMTSLPSTARRTAASNSRSVTTNARSNATTTFEPTGPRRTSVLVIHVTRDPVEQAVSALSEGSSSPIDITAVSSKNSFTEERSQS